MAALIHWGRAYFARSMCRRGLLNSAELMVRFTTLIIILHLSEMLVWTMFYHWKCFHSWGSAFYFSAASYSTVGYGDVVLPRMWRALGPIEGITGVLMCGLSASLLFAIVTRLVERESRAERKLAKPASTLTSKPTSSRDLIEKRKVNVPGEMAVLIVERSLA